MTESSGRNERVACEAQDVPSRNLQQAANRNERFPNRRLTIGIAGSVDSIYVGLTRATQQLFIVGDYTHLSRFSPWDRIGYFLKTYPPEDSDRNINNISYLSYYISLVLN